MLELVVNIEGLTEYPWLHNAIPHLQNGGPSYARYALIALASYILFKSQVFGVQIEPDISHFGLQFEGVIGDIYSELPEFIHGATG